MNCSVFSLFTSSLYLIYICYQETKKKEDKNKKKQNKKQNKKQK